MRGPIVLRFPPRVNDRVRFQSVPPRESGDVERDVGLAGFCRHFRFLQHGPDRSDQGGDDGQDDREGIACAGIRELRGSCPVLPGTAAVGVRRRSVDASVLHRHHLDGGALGHARLFGDRSQPSAVLSRSRAHPCRDGGVHAPAGRCVVSAQLCRRAGDEVERPRLGVCQRQHRWRWRRRHGDQRRGGHRADVGSEPDRGGGHDQRCDDLSAAPGVRGQPDPEVERCRVDVRGRCGRRRDGDEPDRGQRHHARAESDRRGGTIAADTTYLQRRVSAVRSAAAFARSTPDGSVVCEAVADERIRARRQCFGATAVLGTTDQPAAGRSRQRQPGDALRAGRDRAPTWSEGRRELGSAKRDRFDDRGRRNARRSEPAIPARSHRSEAVRATWLAATATVGGGTHNTASAQRGAIAGGTDNSATGLWSSVGGGNVNTASGVDSTVAGGSSNVASGDYSTVPGAGNAAPGYYSFAAGSGAHANYAGCFVYADTSELSTRRAASDRTRSSSAGSAASTSGRREPRTQPTAAHDWPREPAPGPLYSDRNGKERIHPVDPAASSSRSSWRCRSPPGSGRASRARSATWDRWRRTSTTRSVSATATRRS